MRYQALALDLDGTLTNSRKEVTPATRAALGRAMFEGCKVILASGCPGWAATFWPTTAAR